MRFFCLTRNVRRHSITTWIGALLILTLVAMWPASGACGTLEQSFDEMKAKYPDYVADMKANGATEQQILAFIRDLDQILSRKNLNEENFNDEVLNAAWSLKDEPEHQAVIDALFAAFGEEIGDILHGKMPSSLVPIRDLLKERLLTNKDGPSGGASGGGIEAGEETLSPGQTLENALGSVFWDRQAKDITFRVEPDKLSAHLARLDADQPLSIRFPVLQDGGQPGPEGPPEQTIQMDLKQFRESLSGGKARDLNIEFAGVSLGIPKQDVSGLGTEQDSSGACVMISVGTSDWDDRITNDHSAQGYTFGGKVYQVKVTVQEKDEVLPVSESPLNAIVSLNVTPSEGLDPALCGVYRLEGNDSGIQGGWVYQGGDLTQSRTRIAARVAVPGKFGMMQYSKEFLDIPPAHWARRSVEIMAARHVARGNEQGLFEPDSYITRAEFAALLQRTLWMKESAESATKFKDVKPGAWYLGAVGAASQAGIINGYSDSTFGPNEAITREEMAAMITRAAVNVGGLEPIPYADVANSLSSFRDTWEISQWAKFSVAQAVEMGIVKGKDPGVFAPREKSKRVEAVVMLNRLLAVLGRL